MLSATSSPIPSLFLAAFRQGVLPALATSLGAWTSLRTATKKAGGSAKQDVGSLPKHLGMKMSSGELAFPGMIIVRQRGTKFRPGQNVGLGRDHTLFATSVGIVRVSTQPGPSGKERRFVSVEPLPEVAAAAADRVGAAACGDAAKVEEGQRLVIAELVQRRAQVKRAILQGSVPLEPALFFNLPKQPDGRLSWLEHSTTVHAVPKATLAAPHHPR